MKKTKSKKSAKKKPVAKASQRRPVKSGVGLKGTVGKLPKAEMRHHAWNAIPVTELNPLLGRQLVVGRSIMLARVLLKKGCIVPEHSHPNEQLTYIAEGALKFWIDGQEIVVGPGQCLTIPANMPHKAEALEDTVDFDVFTPPRADWMSNSDTYLR